ncbi:hypothetical protein SAMN05444161_2174 [Rhizobiales bacterium GAS191]|jgi:hypothetical protein|nr:hypothetical protein SAMN05519103_01288 [Rhizobiales bacterium GAS113]SEC94880.1 hypothetical protein SAMN05444161_2174 [Rhizobiales bacterium GAS191]
MIRTTDRVAGNPFKLGASRQTPFVLPPEQADLGSLVKQLPH